jgi:hypothetical protein
MMMHDIVPYTLFRTESGINLQLWSDPFASKPSELDIKG